MWLDPLQWKKNQQKTNIETSLKACTCQIVHDDRLLKLKVFVWLGNGTCAKFYTAVIFTYDHHALKGKTGLVRARMGPGS